MDADGEANGEADAGAFDCCAAKYGMSEGETIWDFDAVVDSWPESDNEGEDVSCVSRDCEFLCCQTRNSSRACNICRQAFFCSSPSRSAQGLSLIDINWIRRVKSGS